MPKRAFGSLLRKKRQELSLTRSALADRLGVAPTRNKRRDAGVLAQMLLAREPFRTQNESPLRLANLTVSIGPPPHRSRPESCISFIHRARRPVITRVRENHSNGRPITRSQKIETLKAKVPE